MGWELAVSVVRELLDGTPRKEFRWVETAGGLKPWSASALRGEPLEKRLDADRWLGIHPVAPGPASYLLAQARSHPAADVNAPELAEWTKGSLLNLGTVMEEMGVAFPGKGHFAAMDPLSNRVFVVTDLRNQELAAEWFSGFLDGVVDPPIWIATNPAAGGWGITAGSGEVAQIERSGGDEGGGLLFRCEPTRGGDGIMMDLRYSMDVVVGDTKTGRIEGATTLVRDEPQTLGGGSGSEGEEAKVIVTASDAGG